MKTAGITIYSIRCMENGKMYVGATDDIERRWREHQGNSGSAITSDMRRLGPEKFEFSVIEIVSKERAAEREKFWIQKLNSGKPHGYNYLHKNLNRSMVRINLTVSPADARALRVLAQLETGGSVGDLAVKLVNEDLAKRPEIAEYIREAIKEISD